MSDSDRLSFDRSVQGTNPPSIKNGPASIYLKKLVFLALGLCVFTLPGMAYIGPGAGFAFLSSFLVLFLTFFLAVFSFLSWPFRLILRLLRGQKAYKKSRINQLVIVGLDVM
jgi:hypothetical protein